MLRTSPEIVYDNPDSLTPKDYIIGIGDEFSMQVLSNNGYALIDIIGTSSGSSSAISYTIKTSGYASLPLIDSLKIVGMSVVQLEKVLAEKYSYYFINPFIKLKVLTKRVLIFRGRGVASVLSLPYDHMQLIEVIASAGGVSGGKAYRVRVIRGDIKNPKVYVFDFSTLEGYKNADFLITSNDIIYIEPSLSVSAISEKILPYLSLFTTIVLVYTTIATVKKI